jgi:hypothetical protein
MGYLDNSSITIDAILTKKGRELLARNDGSFQITQFALADDEIDYTMFNENHPNGSQYVSEAIENMALIEAHPDENNIMRHKLVTLDVGSTVIPFLNIGTNIIKLGLGSSQTITPKTVNYQGNTAQQAEPGGYTYTIADARLLTSFTSTMTSQAAQGDRAISKHTTTSFSETVIGNSVSMVGISKSALFGVNTTLLTTLTIEGRDTGARLTVPVEISKNMSQTTPAASTATPSQAV